MSKGPQDESASELPGSSVPPPSGVTEREGSWRVPTDGRASAVIIATTDVPPWADAASAAARLRTELATAPDALGAAAAIVRVVAPLFPSRAIAVRLGVDTVAIASSRPLGKDQRLERTLAVAKSALER